MISVVPLQNLLEEGGEANWAFLTTLPKKQYLYSRETYFREAWHDFRQVFGNETLRILQQIAFLVLKPDAFAGRRVETVLDVLENRNFVPIATQRFRWSRHTIREDWRYQLNQLSLERMELSTRLMTATDSLLVVLRDDNRPLRVPAAVRLQAMKGSSLPERHQADQLRRILKSPNRLLKFIHTADEPADIVREMGIHFDGSERRLLLETIGRSLSTCASEALRLEISHINEEVPPHELDFNISWGRIRALLRARASSDSAAAALLASLECVIERREKSSFLSVHGLERELRQISLQVSFWDLLVFSAHLIHHSYENEIATIESDGGQAWFAGLGKMSFSNFSTKVETVARSSDAHVLVDA
jgi:hypothetical protein